MEMVVGPAKRVIFKFGAVLNPVYPDFFPKFRIYAIREIKVISQILIC